VGSDKETFASFPDWLICHRRRRGQERMEVSGTLPSLNDQRHTSREITFGERRHSPYYWAGKLFQEAHIHFRNLSILGDTAEAGEEGGRLEDLGLIIHILGLTKFIQKKGLINLLWNARKTTLWRTFPVAKGT